MIKNVFLFFVVLMCVVFTGCGSQVDTESGAESNVESSDDVQQVSDEVQDEHFNNKEVPENYNPMTEGLEEVIIEDKSKIDSIEPKMGYNHSSKKTRKIQMVEESCTWGKRMPNNQRKTRIRLSVKPYQIFV